LIGRLEKFKPAAGLLGQLQKGIRQSGGIVNFGISQGHKKRVIHVPVDQLERHKFRLS
jgi:hypothetical protein